jgi:hypothetical protein
MEVGGAPRASRGVAIVTTITPAHRAHGDAKVDWAPSALSLTRFDPLVLTRFDPPSLIHRFAYAGY